MKRFLLLMFVGIFVTPLCSTSMFAQTLTATPDASACAEVPALKARAERAETRLKDWAQLARYREANTKVITSSRAERRVVFMGDSITDRWDDESYGGFFPGKPYVNRGIGGQTTGQMLIRFYPDVIALRPQVVVILAGTNDISRDPTPETLQEVEDNIAAMAELARAHNIRVVFASLLPVHDNGRDRDGKPIKRTDRRPPAQLRDLNAWMKDYATRHNQTYLDYHTGLVNNRGLLRDELSDDGLHANAKGYAIMKPLAEAAIAKALGKR